MSKQISRLAAIATATLLSVAPHSVLAAAVTFDGVTPVTIAVPGSVTVDNGFVASFAGNSADAKAIIDSGSSALVTAACFTTQCSDSGSQAAFMFQNASLTLSAPAGDTFEAISFKAALASIWPPVWPYNSAVRLEVDGYTGSSQVASNTFLLLPPEYTGTQPADTASLDATTFSAIALSGYTGIDTLVFTLLGALGGDPDALTVDTGFSPEFAIDTIAYDHLQSSGGGGGGGGGGGDIGIPEPATVTLLLAGLAGLTVSRRRRIA
jgi:hypothetical protein